MREQRQREAVEAYMDSADGRTIINACPRFGKIKVAIDIIKRMKFEYPCIIYPRSDIAEGWKSDFEKFGYIGDWGMFTTRSIKYIEDKAHDVYILDELHEYSVNQMVELSKKILPSAAVIGLTGTLTNKTRKEVYDNLGLDVCYEYTVADGVRDGIIADYLLQIHKVPLDNKVIRFSTKKGKFTEKRYFDMFNYVMKERKSPFMSIKLTQIIQNSIAKQQKTRELIDEEEGRILVFCGTTEIADNLGIPAYHSKNNEKELFQKFCTGQGVDKLATIKMMQAGVTVNPINRGIINYMSGNPEDSAQKICRFLGFEYDNPDKKAIIDIVSSTEEFEQVRLKTGLAFFEKEKILEKNV